MVLRSTLLALTAVAAAAVAGQAAAQTRSPEHDCFYSRNINGFSAVDDETLNIRVGVRDVYQLKLFAPSSDIRWARGIALISHGGSFICSKLDATVVASGSLGPQRYPLKSIRRLTPEEVAALPRNQRP